MDESEIERDFLELAKEAARLTLPQELKGGLSVAADHEMHDPEREVNAQLVSAPDLPSFSMPAVKVGRDAATVLAGTAVRLAPRWTANAGVSHSASSNASTTGVFATLSASFF